MTLEIQQIPSLADDPTPAEQKVTDLVRMWGDLNTDGILDSSCEIFMTPEIDGLIGYRTCSGQAVVFGDPVCAASDKPALAQAFQNYCRNKKLGVLYTIASESFADWVIKNLSGISIEFGEKLILDPFNRPVNKRGSKAGLVRKKVKHAKSEGLLIEEYTGSDKKIETAIENVCVRWLQNRSGPQIYLAKLALFEKATGKRWFYAHSNGKIVGIMLLNQLKAQNGWLLNNLMVTKEAPNGTSELLVIETLQILEKENCHRVIIGPIPSAKVGKVNGLGRLKTKIARFAYKFLIKMFKLSGQGVFWEKFQPEAEPNFLVFPDKNLSYSSVKALLSAYNARIGN